MPSAVATTRAKMGRFDFNFLERRAADFIVAGRSGNAMAIYLYMANGDPSLDANYLGERIGRCCELLGDLHGAIWWYGSAIEENPEVPLYVEARRRLNDVSIEHLLSVKIE